MTRREQRVLLACAILLSVVCALLFARAILAQRAAGLARAQARAALLPAQKPPSSDAAERSILSSTGAIGLTHFWQAVQNFRLVSTQARAAAGYTAVSLALIFRLQHTEASLIKVAANDDSRPRRSQLEDMLGIAYFYDAALHPSVGPVESQLHAKAIRAFRRAALLDDSNDDAKTDLDLLLRKQQRRQQQRQEQHQKALPDQSRAEETLGKSGGLPSQNGAVGRHFSGGY